jgi:transposase
MGHAYSDDLRQKLLAAYDRHEVMMEELAERFCVSVSLIKKLVRQRRQTGSISAKPHAGGTPPRLTPEHLAVLEAEIEKTPDATQAELAERLHASGAPRVSCATIGRAVRKLALTRKKSPGRR